MVPFIFGIVDKVGLVQIRFGVGLAATILHCKITLWPSFAVYADVVLTCGLTERVIRNCIKFNITNSQVQHGKLLI